MKKMFMLFLIAVMLTGCQGTDQTTANTEKEETNQLVPITRIVVYEWGSDIVHTTITDKEFINQLVQELAQAETALTVTMDFADPDYRLEFKTGDEVVRELGYYLKVMKLGVDGRYFDWNEDKIYGVQLELPI